MSSTKAKSKAKFAAVELVGREREAHLVRAALKAGRNILLEGPVGVGKTHLALSISGEMGVPVFRVDGDNRYSEQKLAGWFDPPLVLKQGFGEKSFVPGPLVEAMRTGGILFINELNRLPEGVQNVLLPAIDERFISIPRLGEVRAREGFRVVATQNPKEFVATSHLSEAILDRFELVVLGYQSEEEEIEIVTARLGALKGEAALLPTASVRLARLTREHPRVRRGASIRAAMSVTEIASVLMKEGAPLKQAFMEAILMALPTRIEIERDAEAERSARQEVESMLENWAQQILDTLGEKKKI